MAIDINSTSPVIAYIGDGSETDFVVPWPFYANGDLKVYVDGVLKTISTHYTIAGAGDEAGGTVTFLSAPADDAIVTIVGDATIQRTTHFPGTGKFNIDRLNRQLNELVIYCKQLLARTQRGVRAPDTDTVATVNAMPVAAARAGKALVFDGDGNPDVSEDNYNDQLAAVTAQAAAAAASAAAASASEDDAEAAAAAAASSETIATTKAGEADTSADEAAASQAAAAVSAAAAASSQSAAAASATSASGSASTATTQAAAASASASAASGSASTASTQATNAAASSTAAAAAQVAAEAALASTLTAYDNFDDRYLGAKTSAPTLDNDGNALVAGALYYQSTGGTPGMYVYTGSAWVAAYISGAGYLASANNLSDVGDAATAFSTIKQAASATATGVVELATDAETQTGTDTVRAVTPANLTARTATETRTGIVELATDAETQTGSDTARAITPANLSARTATETRTGIVELATTAEAAAGTDTARAVTAAGVAAAIAALAPTPKFYKVLFTASGTFSKGSYPTILAGTKVRIRLRGGGGAGGSAAGSGGANYGQGGGGGGEGGYSEKLVLGSDLGTNETVTISAGGTTSFGSHCSATAGGAGEAGGSGSGGGDGGSGSGGDINRKGQGGAPGVIQGDIPVAIVGGSGGGEGGGRGGKAATAGTAGANGGGGGGGGSSSAAGGAASVGWVEVEWIG